MQPSDVRTSPGDAHGDGAPSAWVSRFLPLVRRSGRVLDLACGGGRHAKLAAGMGLEVTALDRNRDALAGMGGLPGISAIEHDLEAEGARWPFDAGAFDGIIVTNYLHRPLMADILAALAPGGVLIYETFTAGNEKYGKPSRPAFLLQPGELLDACAALTIVAFEQGRETAPSECVRQRICAVRDIVPAEIALP
ncbi:MAG: class I SAM-dependent methyltransferase [Rhodospirillales bacterium]